MKSDLPYNVLRHRDWDVAPRDPFTVGNAIFAAIGAQTSSLALIWGVGYLATTAITSLALRALAPKPASPNQGQIINARNPVAPQEYVYGEVRKGGTIVFMETTGDNNKFMHMVIALAGHECEEIGDIYINDEIVTLSDSGSYIYTFDVETLGGTEGFTRESVAQVSGVSTGFSPTYSVGDTITNVTEWNNLLAAGSTDWPYQTDSFGSATVTARTSSAGFVTGDRWKSKIRIKKWDGSQTTSDSDFTSATSADGYYVGYGIAALYVRLEYDQDVFSSGLPTFSAVVKGRKVYDPRAPLDPDAWSDNAALCIRDYLTTAIGLNDSAVDDTYFSSAANDCDDDITLAAGGTENRYRLNAVINAESEIGTTLGDMVRACNGTLYLSGGDWRLRVGVYSAPVKDFTLDDMRSEISLQTRASRSSNFNRVVGRFINGGVEADGGGDWIEAEFPPIESATFLAEDGGVENTLDLTLNMVTSGSQAQRVAKQTLFRAREQMVLSADFGLRALEVEVGDIVSLTIPEYGWTAKEFEVSSWSLVVGDGGGLRCPMVLRETSEAAFAWDAEETAITGNDSTLPRYTPAPAITSMTTDITKSDTNGDGSYVPVIGVAWDVEYDNFVSYYEVEWRKNSDAWAATTTVQKSISIVGVLTDQDYYFRVRPVSVDNTVGDWAYVSQLVNGDSTPPALPTSVTASGGFGNIVLGWVNPSDPDFKAVRIYVNDTNDNTTATLLAEVGGSTYVHAGLATGVTRYYWLASVDFSGNSTYDLGAPNWLTTGVTATTTSVSTEDLTVTGDATIAGDLTVNGTTTTLNVTELEIEDLNITVASGATTPAEAHGAGINVDGAGAAIQYNSTYDRWDMNKGLGVTGVFYLVPQTQPSSPYVGMTYMDSSDNIMYTWDGTNWRPHYGSYLELE